MLSTNAKLALVLLLHSVHHHTPSSNDGHGYGDDTHHLEVNDLLDDDGGGGTADMNSPRATGLVPTPAYCRNSASQYCHVYSSCLQTIGPHMPLPTPITDHRPTNILPTSMPGTDIRVEVLIVIVIVVGCGTAGVTSTWR